MRGEKSKNASNWQDWQDTGKPSTLAYVLLVNKVRDCGWQNKHSTQFFVKLFITMKENHQVVTQNVLTRGIAVRKLSDLEQLQKRPIM